MINESKRFVIELFTGVSIEEWHRNNELLKEKFKGNKPFAEVKGVTQNRI